MVDASLAFRRLAKGGKGWFSISDIARPPGPERAVRLEGKCFLCFEVNTLRKNLGPILVLADLNWSEMGLECAISDFAVAIQSPAPKRSIGFNGHRIILADGHRD